MARLTTSTDSGAFPNAHRGVDEDISHPSNKRRAPQNDEHQLHGQNALLRPVKRVKTRTAVQQRVATTKQTYSNQSKLMQLHRPPYLLTYCSEIKLDLRFCLLPNLTELRNSLSGEVIMSVERTGFRRLDIFFQSCLKTANEELSVGDWTLRTFPRDMRHPTDPYSWRTIILGIVPSWAKEDAFEWCKNRGFLSPVLPLALPGLSARVLGPFVDPTLIWSWLRFCARAHNCPKSASNRIPVDGMSLVNCRRRFIEDAKPGMRYVALSYVWGDGHASLFQADLSNPAKVVEDAMTVVCMLQMDYLWVDRYCIPSDKEKNHHQIANMDRIYSAADLTIIAAAGESADYGLPGVSSPRKSPQPVIPPGVLGTFGLAYTMADPEVIIRHSKWNTRGWTYQEALLSRRRLFFTDQQMYYECGSMCRQETVNIKLPSAHLESKDLSEIVVVRGPVFCTDGRHTVKENIESYSKRHLTYSADILNGILGVFRKYERLDPPVHHAWGIPILPLDRSGKAQIDSFVSGLCWDVAWPSFRRAEFPSWCWTGWHSPIKFASPLDTPGKIDISIETAYGKVVSWDDASQFYTQSDHRLLSRYLHLRCQVFEAQFEAEVPEFLIENQGRIKAVPHFYLQNLQNFKYRIPLKLTVDVEIPLNGVTVRTFSEWTGLAKRLISDSWICSILKHENDGSIARALVLDRVHDHYERIGYIDKDYALNQANPGLWQATDLKQSDGIWLENHMMELRLG